MVRVLGATSCCQAINEQDNNSATYRQAHAPQVKSRNIPEPEERAEKTTDDRSHDPQQDGGDDSSRLFPGHEEPGQDTGDQANPGLDARLRTSAVSVSTGSATRTAPGAADSGSLFAIRIAYNERACSRGTDLVRWMS